MRVSVLVAMMLAFSSVAMAADTLPPAEAAQVQAQPQVDIAQATQKSLEATLGALIVNNTQCSQQNLAAAGVIADLRRQLAAAQAKNEAPATGAPAGK